MLRYGTPPPTGLVVEGYQGMQWKCTTLQARMLENTHLSESEQVALNMTLPAFRPGMAGALETYQAFCCQHRLYLLFGWALVRCGTGVMALWDWFPWHRAKSPFCETSLDPAA